VKSISMILMINCFLLLIFFSVYSLTQTTIELISADGIESFIKHFLWVPIIISAMVLFAFFFVIISVVMHNIKHLIDPFYKSRRRYKC
jgi:hypothetical protein